MRKKIQGLLSVLLTLCIAVNLLSVTALALTDQEETYVQESLFEPRQSGERLERLEETVDAIRKKYGGKAIVYGDAASQAGRLHRADEE